MRTLLFLIVLGVLGFAVFWIVEGRDAGSASRRGPANDLPSREARLVELPPDSRRSGTFEHCVWIDGPSALEITAAGSGTGRVILEDEGGVRTEICVMELDDQVEVREVALEPGPLRPVRLLFYGPTSFRWRKLRMVGADPGSEAQPSAQLERGALAGYDVIVILFDALRADHLSAWGHERPTSPHIDALAKDGVRFAQARSQTAWTLPSVVSLFTSLEQEVHGVTRSMLELDADRATLGASLAEVGYRTVALVQNLVAERSAGWARGVERYRKFTHELDQLDSLLDEAVAAVATERDDGRPLFLYAHLLPPHGPYLWPPDGRTEFNPEYEGPVDGSTPAVVDLIRSEVPADHPDVLHLVALYDEYIRYVDARVGETLERMRAASARPTLFVLLSDHGESFLEHGLLGHEHQVFDESLRVPLIFAATDDALPRGIVVDTAVDLLDVYPTLVELLGLPAPQTPLRGRSLVPALAGAPMGADPLFASGRERDKGKLQPQRGVTYAGYKLVHTLARGIERYELFDLGQDPGETRDISLKHPVRTDAMKTLLADWLVETSAAKSMVLTVDGQRSEEELAELRKLGYLGDADGG